MRGSMAASTSRRPKICPVCGSANLKKNSLSNGVDHQDPPAIQSYRCNRGHVFLVEKVKSATPNS
jgi:transposase-like protein